MTTADIAPGTIVEVLEPGASKGQFAVVVEPNAELKRNFDHHEGRIWVRYDNESVVPVREYWVHTPTVQQVLAILNDRL